MVFVDLMYLLSFCNWPDTTKFSRITQKNDITLFKISFRVTDFGATRKFVYDFRSVNNTNLPPVLHRFKLFRIIGQIFLSNRGVALINTLVLDEPLNSRLWN